MPVIQDNASTIVVSPNTSVFQISGSIQNSTAVYTDVTTNIVLNSPADTIVVEKSNDSTISAGYSSPSIPEDDTMYSKRIDFITDNELYRGEAVVGSSESDAVWRIRKITIAALDGDISERWSSGTAAFDKVWGNRVSYTYL